MTLTEAVEIALARSYAIRLARIELDAAGTRIEEAWSSVYPRVDLTGQYTRNLEQPDPFAGSDAGGFFEQLGAIGWLFFNNQAGADGDPNTNPISLAEFRGRQADGLRAAGIDTSNGGLFFVPNSFVASARVSQVIYDGAAFAAIRAAEAYRELSEAGIQTAIQDVVAQVTQAYLGAQLATAAAEVTAKAVERAGQTVEDVKRYVAQGVLPRFAQLSAEVELANLETQLIEARAAADDAIDGLALLLDAPPGQRLALRTPLGPGPDQASPAPAPDAAMAVAEQQRPEVRALGLTAGLREVEVKLAESAFSPTLSGFFNFGWIGNVPDDREQVISDSMDPFAFTREELGFFDDQYWSSQVNIGLLLQWNIFDGWATTQRAERARIEVRRAKTQLGQLRRAIRTEIETALRRIETASRRFETQSQNIERAELNYGQTRARVNEGVATPTELREASQQLDLSRLGRLRAVHDFAVAWTQYEIAVGTPPSEMNVVRAARTTIEIDEGAP